MEYKLKNKVQYLRKITFNQFNNIIDSDNHCEIEMIDSILSVLSSFNETFPRVSDILQDEYEMGYYDFEEIYNKKDIIFNLALSLKKEIIEKLEYNEKFLNSHEDIKYSFDDNDDISLLRILYSQTKILLSNCDILGNLLSKHGNLKFYHFTPLLKELNNLYSTYSDIYADYEEFTNDFNDDESSYIDDNLDELNNLDDDTTEEDFYDKWKDICTFNYDIALIDDIYCCLFDNINDEQRLLIGIMVSDFYEYHKCNEKMYTKPDNLDIIDSISYIENHTYEEIIQYFLRQPTWSGFIIDTYIYYNTNFTSEEKLANRNSIKSIGKLNILKNNNKFMNDTLKDETLYNTFITSINELIRSLNYSVFYKIDSIDNSHKDELFFRYFTSDFIPNGIDDDIPEDLKDIDIKILKRLQLRFIISDFFARKLSDNNSDIEVLLKFSKPDGLYNAIVTDEYRLKHILKKFGDDLQKDDEVNLNEEQRQKIIKFNALSALDIF